MCPNPTGFIYLIKFFFFSFHINHWKLIFKIKIKNVNKKSFRDLVLPSYGSSSQRVLVEEQPAAFSNHANSIINSCRMWRDTGCLLNVEILVDLLSLLEGHPVRKE